MLRPSSSAPGVLHLYLTYRPPTPEDIRLKEEVRAYSKLCSPPGTPRLKGIGWPVLRPNVEVRPGRRDVATNALGFRDLPQTAVKKEGDFRLVVIGDSYVYGQGIADVRDIFAYRTGVDNIGGKDLNVVLMGFCGADLIVYNAMFHDMALEFDPDAVLITLISNDLEDKTRIQPVCLPEMLPAEAIVKTLPGGVSGDFTPAPQPSAWGPRTCRPSRG